MKTFITAVAPFAVIGLVALVGCNDARDNLVDAQRDVQETRQEAAEDIREAELERQETMRAATREMKEEVVDAQENVAEAERDLQEAQENLRREQLDDPASTAPTLPNQSPAADPAPAPVAP